MKHITITLTEDQARSLEEAVNSVLKDLWDFPDNNTDEIAYWQRLKQQVIAYKYVSKNV